MEWRVEELPRLRGYTVEWAEDGDFILSRRNVLYSATSLDGPLSQIAAIDAPFWKRSASRSRLAQRLLRFMVTNVVRLASDELFVTFDKSVGVVRNGRYRPLDGLHRPCRVLRSACAVDADGNVFFGEYLANEERGEMRIYKFTAGTDMLDAAYVFPPDSIKHIHGIYFDEFTGSLVCLTGDKVSECRVLRSFDGFRTIETIGEGDETWRAVSVVFGKKNFYYGTDAEFRANQIFRVDRADHSRTPIAEVDGTVFYSKRLGDNIFFTTTAENAPSQKENVAALWHVDPDGRCRELAKFQKDRWHKTLFMFGTIHFPYHNASSDNLYFSLVGVDGDNRVYCVRSI